MYCTSIPLREHFPFLAQKNSGAVLDLFLPYNSVEMGREHQKRPCLLVCPGGGYAMVSEREGEPIALCFLPQGFNVFVLRYSVAPHRFPTQLLEVAAAMQLICQKAEEWNCDTDKIAIMGFSAGGHLAGHYSNRYNGPEVRQYFPQGVKPAASLLCYPVVTAGEYAHLGSFLNLLGHEPDEKEQADFSLEKMVTDDTPPAFLCSARSRIPTVSHKESKI